MPRLQHRKAAKDYPDAGISKGDMYYYVKIKTGPRSSRTIRSVARPKPSQLTSSPFKSGWYGMEESLPVTLDAENIKAAADIIRELGQAAAESFENMPEGLQQGDTGQLLEARRDECEQVADQLDTLADELYDLEEPEEPADPDSEDAALEYETAQQEFDSDYERITSEARELTGEMPE